MDATVDPRPLYGGEPLPIGSKGRLSSGWWGMIAVIATSCRYCDSIFDSR